MMSQKLQYIKRVIELYLPGSTSHKIVLITGARQTGKTTLVRNKYKDLKYINIDAPEYREVIRERPSVRWGIDIGNAIFDEAQKEPLVFEKIKFAYDENQVNFSVISGSSQILLIRKIRESLAGRVWIYELFPFLISELTGNLKNNLFHAILNKNDFSHILEKAPSFNINHKSNEKYYEKTFLKYGSMPPIFHLEDENDKKMWLKNYSHTYLERDLTDLARLNDLMPFRKFQRLSALRSGKLINFSELARDTGISVDTAKRYFEYLKISYQTIMIYPFYKNLTSSVIKTPKLYWLDIGLLRELTGYWGDIITGEIFETLVIGEFYKYIKTHQLDVNIFFYRTRSGMEVDLMLEINGKFLLIEIKNREKIVKSDYKNIKILKEKLKDRFFGGMVIYRGDKIYKLEESIWAMPFYRLWEIY